MEPDILVREALVGYADDGPPVPYTSDGLISAGKKSRRRHRFALCATSVAAVAALIGGTLLVLPQEREPFQAAGPSWTALDPTAFCGQDTKEARVSCVLATELPKRLLPGTTFHLRPEWPGDVPFEAVTVDGESKTVKDGTHVQPAKIEANGVVADAEGAAVIGIVVGPTKSLLPHPECTGPCAESTGPGGELIQVISLVDSSGLDIVNVYVFGSETTVFMSAVNEVRPIVSGPEPHEVPTERRLTRDRVPISAEALVDIALDPGLRVYP